jgi:hypothetical protein
VKRNGYNDPQAISAAITINTRGLILIVGLLRKPTSIDPVPRAPGRHSII